MKKYFKGSSIDKNIITVIFIIIGALMLRNYFFSNTSNYSNESIISPSLSPTQPQTTKRPDIYSPEGQWKWDYDKNDWVQVEQINQESNNYYQNTTTYEQPIQQNSAADYLEQLDIERKQQETEQKQQEIKRKQECQEQLNKYMMCMTQYNYELNKYQDCLAQKYSNSLNQFMYCNKPVQPYCGYKPFCF